jgi:hypothetical protein
MKINFVASRTAREDELLRALSQGIPRTGDQIEVAPEAADPRDLSCDVFAIVGLKKTNLLRWLEASGRSFLYFDKAPRCLVPIAARGYSHNVWPSKEAKRQWQARNVLWRVSAGSTQPLEYVETALHTSARWDGLEIEMRSWRKPTKDGHIIVADSSPKYHKFHGLLPASEWSRGVVSQIRQYTDRPIWYRPKPVWSERSSAPIDGTEYRPKSHLSTLLPNCHVVVTHGSYICVDALVAGVPCITLGPAITRSLSSHCLSDINDPKLAPDFQRSQILANLAWCQYSLEEWESGFAWSNVRDLLLS